MANIKISEMDSTAILNDDDYLMIVQSNRNKKISGENTFKSFINLVYPVGSIYMSVNSTNPGTIFGGTWVAWGAGRVPVGVDTTQTEFETTEKIGGEKTHTLTINEMPKHTHDYSGIISQYNGQGGGATNNERLCNTGSGTTTSTGGGQAHNILQPYITCYMWKRTA